MTKAEILKNYAEMCETTGCTDCPLTKVKGRLSCRVFMMVHPALAVEIIEQWAEQQKHKDEVPFIDYLMSKLPIIDRDTLIKRSCPNWLHIEGVNPLKDICGEVDCCEQCWSQPFIPPKE